MLGHVLARVVRQESWRAMYPAGGVPASAVSWLSMAAIATLRGSTRLYMDRHAWKLAITMDCRHLDYLVSVACISCLAILLLLSIFSLSCWSIYPSISVSLPLWFSLSLFRSQELYSQRHVAPYQKETLDPIAIDIKLKQASLGLKDAQFSANHCWIWCRKINWCGRAQDVRAETQEEDAESWVWGHWGHHWPDL